MKTTLTNLLTLAAVALTTGSLGGCRGNQTSPPPPQAHGVPAAKPVSAATAPVVVVPAAPPLDTAASTAIGNSAPGSVVETAPAMPALSPGVAEVVQLAQAQVGEAVVLEYVMDAPVPYDMTSAEIVYLKDVGLSEPVIEAMIQRGRELRAQGTPTPSAANASSPDGALVRSAAELSASAPPLSPRVYETPVAAPAAPAPAPVTNNYFYDALSPYGSWVQVPDNGWCWRPTCTVVDPTWQPYYDNGSWVYSDAGWYWNSYYSWGWAPFHYGRWHRSSRWGWVWTPGHVWGPSWVTWRYTDSYCGWAPLPPACGWSTGVGLTWHGSSISVGFGFGLSYGSYCFVPSRSFFHPHPYRHGVPGQQANQIYNNSTVVNNVITGNNNTIINGGIAPERLPASTRSELRKVALRDVSPGKGVPENPGQINDRRGELAVYRPKVPPQLSRPAKGEDRYDPPYHATTRTASWDTPKPSRPTTRTLSAAPARSARLESRSPTAPIQPSLNVPSGSRGSFTANGPVPTAPSRRELGTPPPQRAPSVLNQPAVTTRRVQDRGGITRIPASPSSGSPTRTIQPTGSSRPPTTTSPGPSQSAPGRTSPKPVAPLQIMPGRAPAPTTPAAPTRVGPTPSAPTRSPASSPRSPGTPPIQSRRSVAFPSRSGFRGGPPPISRDFNRPSLSSPPSRNMASPTRSAPPAVAPSAPRMSAPSVSPRSSTPVRPTTPRMSAPTMRAPVAPTPTRAPARMRPAPVPVAPKAPTRQ